MEVELRTRNPYPSDVSNEEWAFVVPYLTLMTKDAPQPRHDLRKVFNALRWMVRAGAAWRMLPNDFPRWEAVYEQTQRWIAAGCFETMVHDLRALLRWSMGRADEPTAVILDSATRQSAPESGHRAGYDGHKKRTDSKHHAAVDTLGELLVLHVNPASAGDREQVAALAAAAAHGIRLEVVKLDEAKRGIVLLPRRWVVERSFAWAARCRRLAKDHERLPETVAGLHFVAFACLTLHRLLTAATQSP